MHTCVNTSHLTKKKIKRKEKDFMNVYKIVAFYKNVTKVTSRNLPPLRLSDSSQRSPEHPCLSLCPVHMLQLHPCRQVPRVSFFKTERLGETEKDLSSTFIKMRDYGFTKTRQITIDYYSFPFTDREIYKHYILWSYKMVLQNKIRD